MLIFFVLGFLWVCRGCGGWGDAITFFFFFFLFPTHTKVHHNCQLVNIYLLSISVLAQDSYSLVLGSLHLIYPLVNPCWTYTTCTTMIPKKLNKNRMQWLGNPFQPIFNWMQYKDKIFTINAEVTGCGAKYATFQMLRSKRVSVKNWPP